MNDDGSLRWRVAPTPHGKYWDEGMKVGYQDAGSWTILTNIEGDRRAAAWLWAQFASSKTVSLKKFLVGGTPVRRSTVESDYLTENIDQYGGIIEFYRSPVENQWTDSGPNVPDYPKLSQLWWQNTANAISGDAKKRSIRSPSSRTASWLASSGLTWRPARPSLMSRAKRPTG